MKINKSAQQDCVCVPFWVNTQWNHRRTHTQILSLSLTIELTLFCLSPFLPLNSSCWPPELPKVCYSAKACRWAWGCFLSSLHCCLGPDNEVILLQTCLEDGLSWDSTTCFCHSDWQMLVHSAMFQQYAVQMSDTDPHLSSWKVQTLTPDTACLRHSLLFLLGYRSIAGSGQQEELTGSFTVSSIRHMKAKNIYWYSKKNKKEIII